MDISACGIVTPRGDAGLSIVIPLDNAFQFNSSFQIEGHPVASELERPTADFRTVSADYFRTIGARRWSIR